MLRKLIAAAAALLTPTLADAEWKAVETNHFVIYSDGSEAAARDAAVQLEKYLFVLKTVSHAKTPDSPLKVTLYLVSNTAAVQDAMSFGGNSRVAGFYSRDIRGAYAVMPRFVGGGRSGLTALNTIFHELTHHFMFQYFAAAYPTWYSEGFADFYGSMVIGPKDVVEIGRALPNRELAFRQNQWLPLSKMLSARSYRDVGDSIGELYAQGWLLTHYLSVTGARPGQLGKYLTLVNAGRPYGLAATEAFGDLDKLDSELRSYSVQRERKVMVLPFKAIDTGPVAVRPVSTAEDAMFGYSLATRVGVPAKEAPGFVTRVAAVAARFPNDPAALSTLFEAQLLAGQNAEATATAARWRVAAPADAQAVTAEAVARMAALTAAKSTEGAAWNGVRQLLVTSNRMKPDQPRTLRAYYRTYAARGLSPSATASEGLFRAHEVLPQEDGLRYELAAELERQGEIADAITIIKPLAVKADDTAVSARDKAKREELEAKYRLAGADRNEGANDAARRMLDRLEAAAAKTGAKPAA